LNVNYIRCAHLKTNHRFISFSGCSIAFYVVPAVTFINALIYIFDFSVILKFCTLNVDVQVFS